MKIKTTNYLEHYKTLPQQGQHILGHQTADEIVVYQAYKKEIAEYATEYQKLGGQHFSYSRMSWIKPNFLWMMYRCGWAEKENQEQVLALWIKKSDFEIILENAVYSSYQGEIYDSHDKWRKELDSKDVRLQWDPDHNPYGNKEIRRAIQLGLKGKSLQTFGNELIQKVENITGFVKEQKSYLNLHQIEKLSVPAESVYLLENPLLFKKLAISPE